MTGLYNARHLSAVLPVEIERAKRFDTPLSLIFLDLDRFKTVNDTHGHQIGSRVLAETADLIRNTMRNVDICFRYGGDEFVIVLPQTSLNSGTKAANRLLVALRARRFLSADNLMLRLTASLGVASYPDDAKDATRMIEAADRRMYLVKNADRDGIAAAG